MSFGRLYPSSKVGGVKRNVSAAVFASGCFRQGDLIVKTGRTQVSIGLKMGHRRVNLRSLEVEEA